MGTKLIQLTANGDQASFLVESTEVEETSGLSQATGHVEKEFDKLLGRIKPFCESIIDNFQTLSNKPDTASAEFGLSISAEGNLFVVKASGEATPQDHFELE
jgi:NTP-dependent ternary system trypsin peptidase co-occuring protein